MVKTTESQGSQGDVDEGLFSKKLLSRNILKDKTWNVLQHLAFEFFDNLTSVLLVDFLMSENNLYINKNIHYYYIRLNLLIVWFH